MDAINWLTVLMDCGVKSWTAAAWAPLFTETVKSESFSAGAIEIPDFLGQVLHECARLEHLEEDLHYTIASMMRVWPERFPTVASAQPYAMNPEALANKVYGDRLGNIAPGDGWKYRGSGCIQCTGLANFTLVQKLTGLPVVAQPELLRQPEPALRSAVLWWEARVKDSSMGALRDVTKQVNGGAEGLDDRGHLTELARAALAAS